MKKQGLFIGLGIVTVCLLIPVIFVWLSGGLAESGSLLKRMAYFPQVRRDTQRVYGLREIVKTVAAFYKEKGVLPESINVLSVESLGDFSLMLDPVSHTPYAYHVGSEREIQRLTHPQPIFEICANFEAPSVLIEKNVTPPCPPHGMCLAYLRIQTINPIAPNDEDTTFWDHAKGYNCWEFGSDGEYISGLMLEL